MKIIDISVNSAMRFDGINHDRKPKLVHNHQEHKCSSILHPDFINILFEHRRHAKNAFLAIQGHHGYCFEINIINFCNKVISFSSMLHIEYNVVKENIGTMILVLKRIE